MMYWVALTCSYITHNGAGTAAQIFRLFLIDTGLPAPHTHTKKDSFYSADTILLLIVQKNIELCMCGIIIGGKLQHVQSLSFVTLKNHYK